MEIEGRLKVEPKDVKIRADPNLALPRSSRAFDEL